MERNASGPMRAFAGAVLLFALIAALLSILLWRVTPGSALLIVQLVLGLIPLPLGVVGVKDLAERPERTANFATAALLVEVVWLVYFLFLLLISPTWAPDAFY